MTFKSFKKTLDLWLSTKNILSLFLSLSYKIFYINYPSSDTQPKLRFQFHKMIQIISERTKKLLSKENNNRRDKNSGRYNQVYEGALFLALAVTNSQ